MLSYSLPCAKYVSLVGEAWVAVLCQTVDDEALNMNSPMRCSQLQTRSNGTLELARYAQQLRDTGRGPISQLSNFAAVELSEMRPEDDYTFPAAAKARLVRLVKAVLTATPVAASVGPRMAAHFQVAIELHERKSASDVASEALHRVLGPCLPDQPGEQCVWGVVIESAPEGLHQASGEVQMTLRGLGLTFIVQRRHCIGSSR